MCDCWLRMDERQSRERKMFLFMRACTCLQTLKMGLKRRWRENRSSEENIIWTRKKWINEEKKYRKNRVREEKVREERREGDKWIWKERERERETDFTISLQNFPTNQTFPILVKTSFPLFQSWPLAFLSLSFFLLFVCNCAYVFEEAWERENSVCVCVCLSHWHIEEIIGISTPTKWQFFHNSEMGDKVKLEGERFHKGVEEIHKAWTAAKREKSGLWVGGREDIWALSFEILSWIDFIFIFFMILIEFNSDFLSGRLRCLHCGVWEVVRGLSFEFLFVLSVFLFVVHFLTCFFICILKLTHTHTHSEAQARVEVLSHFVVLRCLLHSFKNAPQGSADGKGLLCLF